MADPYATRRPDLSGGPAGPPPWAGEVEGRGGVPIDAGGNVAGIGSGSCSFVVVPCSGIGSLAPVARVDAAAAVLLWLEHVAASREAAAANDLLARLDGFDGPILAVKQGSVAGPSDRPGSTEVDPRLVGAVLAALGEVEWERDPDFGYEVPSIVPGLADPAARVLLPRLLYADNDRVYEHAGLVADKQRERHAIVAALAGLDPRVVAAAGWPPVPTGGDWRE